MIALALGGWAWALIQWAGRRAGRTSSDGFCKSFSKTHSREARRRDTGTPCRGARCLGIWVRWCHPLSRVQPPATGLDASGIETGRGSAKCQVPSSKETQTAVLGKSGARFKRGDHRYRGFHGVNPVAKCLRPCGAGDRRGILVSHPSYPSWSEFLA